MFCEIDLPSFQDDFAVLNSIGNAACHRLNMALRVICSDDIGKEAARDRLQKVRINNVADKSARRLGVAGGVLIMTGPYGEGLSGAFSDNGIRELLTAPL